MPVEATINARMPDSLKRGGTRVLARNGVSPTQLIRSLYSYMDREDRIPECLEQEMAQSQDKYECRRALARSVAGVVSLPEGFDAKKARSERIDEKYGYLL